MFQASVDDPWTADPTREDPAMGDQGMCETQQQARMVIFGQRLAKLAGRARCDIEVHGWCGC